MKQGVFMKLAEAKRLEYEAVKECMPEQIREHMELSEKHFKEFVKNAGYALYSQMNAASGTENPKSSTESQNNSTENQRNSTENPANDIENSTKSKVKHVTIDYTSERN